MKKQQYTTRTGLKQWKPVLTQNQAFKMMDENMEGFCLACGFIQDGCEPDAEKYTCEKCKLPKVYGLSQLAMMGLVVIK